MVVGNGLVAKRFSNYAENDAFLIFASGVSNSKNTVHSEYEREFELLKHVVNNNQEKIFTYFSTCSVNDPEESESLYVLHKINIENYIRDNVRQYAIFRVSNLVGQSSNPNTILNFIINSISENRHFSLWANATRNLIDVDDFYAISNYILANKLFLNKTINIAHPKSYLVTDIVPAAEQYLNKKGNYNTVLKGSNYKIDISDILPIISQLGIRFDGEYLIRLLNKYY